MKEKPADTSVDRRFLKRAAIILSECSGSRRGKRRVRGSGCEEPFQCLDDLPEGPAGRQLLDIRGRSRRQVERPEDCSGNLYPLDRVDSEVRFQVCIKCEHLGRIAGSLTDHGQELIGDLLPRRPDVSAGRGGQLRRRLVNWRGRDRRR